MLSSKPATITTNIPFLEEFIVTYNNQKQDITSSKTFDCYNFFVLNLLLGIYAACARKKVEWIVVEGIASLGNSDADTADWEACAALNSFSFIQKALKGQCL